MRRGDHARRLRLPGVLPALAQQQCARSQLGGRARQRERLEAARGFVVVQEQLAHGRSLSLRGSDSTSFLRSADRSVVVTSVSPSFATTTRLFTPYKTTSWPSPSACTTLFDASSACTDPLVAFSFASSRRTRCRAPHVPTSSHPKSPLTTSTRLLRSSTA